MLTQEQRRARDGKLTASRAGVLMNGDDAALLQLWREMVGEIAEADLSMVWPVQLGVVTENLNLDWWERTTGRQLTRRGEVVVHPHYNWACATLDGFDEGLIGPVDAKHVGGYEARDRIVSRYFAQMTWQMDCTGTKRAALSIIEGAREPVHEIIEWDAAYSEELWRRAEAFMACIESLSPPVSMLPVAAPVAAVRVADMNGSNSWGECAGVWRDNRLAAQKYERAAKELKALVPDDAVKAFGYGVEASRSKTGAITIRVKS